MAPVERVVREKTELERQELDNHYKWLFHYSLPCHFGRDSAFQRLIKSGNFKPLKCLEDFSRESVRDYFLGLNNELTFQNAMIDSGWYHHVFC
jgi:hypothetical protein